MGSRTLVSYQILPTHEWWSSLSAWAGQTHEDGFSRVHLFHGRLFTSEWSQQRHGNLESLLAADECITQIVNRVSPSTFQVTVVWPVARAFNGFDKVAQRSFEIRDHRFSAPNLRYTHRLRHKERRRVVVFEYTSWKGCPVPAKERFVEVKRIHNRVKIHIEKVLDVPLEVVQRFQNSSV